ncbi:MAG: hypothetical protein ABIY51_08360 [Ferruginibacter sp.]
MNNSLRLLWPLFLVFLINMICILFLGDLFLKYNIDKTVLLGANILFLVLSVVAFLMQKRSLRNKNPNVFIRAVMGGMLLKMFFCVAVVFIYVSLVGNNYNKKAVFISLFIYLFYLAAEVLSLTKLNKKPNG